MTNETTSDQKEKFSVGQNVFITQEYRDDKECPECKGSEKIIYKGKEVKCPICGGDGFLYEWLKRPLEVTISDIKIDIFVNKQGRAQIIKYMFEGYLLENRKEAELFLTDKECAEYIKKGNEND